MLLLMAGGVVVGTADMFDVDGEVVTWGLVVVGEGVVVGGEVVAAEDRKRLTM